MSAPLLPYNTIVLKGDLGRYHDEARSDATAINPGMLIQPQSDGNVVPHAVRGGRCQKWVAKEDALQGNTVSPPNNVYANGDLVMFHKARPGDSVQLLLAIGENVVAGQRLMSHGDGFVCAAASTYYANIVADSTAVTNSTAENTFSNGTVTIPANNLNVGDTIRIVGEAVITGLTSTPTLTIRVRFDNTAAVLLTTGAVSNANGDTISFEIYLTVRTIGSGTAGTFVATGWYTDGTPGTATARALTVASTTFDSTTSHALTVTAQWSAASASNTVVLRQLFVDQVSNYGGAGAPAGGDVVGTAGYAVNNTSGSAAALITVSIHG